MPWERRYFGADKGFENSETKDLIYSVHRNGWEVILNNQSIARDLTEKEAEEFMLREVGKVVEREEPVENKKGDAQTSQLVLF